MRIAVPAFALALIALLAGCASKPSGPTWNPNPTPPPRDENYHGGPNAMILKYDANHDGTVTRQELMAGLRKDFDALDTHHDNCLAKDQVAAINQKRIAADKSTATLLEDWNGDGCVDFREFSAAAVSLFDELDKNGDGKVTPDEFNPKARARRPAPMPGRGPRGPF